MPRRARIDAAGALQHIICRGIERRKIFRDDGDRQEFLGRLGRVLKETQSVCCAWALIPNHFPLLLRSGSTPIKTVMHWSWCATSILNPLRVRLVEAWISSTAIHMAATAR